MKYIGRLLILLAFLVPPFAAHAARFDVVAGPSVTSRGRTTVAAFTSVFARPDAAHSLRFVPIATWGWIDAHRTDMYHLHHAMLVAGGGLRLDATRHWFVSEQLSVVSSHTDALSSRFEFMSSAGWQHHHFIVMVRHISNGHLIGGGRNMGETMLLVGVLF